MRSLDIQLDIYLLEKQQARHEGNSISHSLIQRIAACCRNAGRSIGECIPRTLITIPPNRLVFA